MYLSKIKAVLESQSEDQDTRGCKLLLQAKIARALLDVSLFRNQLAGKYSAIDADNNARHADRERASQVAYALENLLELHRYFNSEDGLMEDLNYISEHPDKLLDKILGEVKKQDFEIKIRSRTMP